MENNAQFLRHVLKSVLFYCSPKALSAQKRYKTFLTLIKKKEEEKKKRINDHRFSLAEFLL